MSKILVAYFSAEGTTQKLAKRLAEAVGAELFEIKPAEPYSKADINWKNPLSRCNKEWFSKKKVPLAEKPENFSSYDLILIGFPIWYAVAPLAVNTFAEENDFSGKKIALFATSGGSKMGKTAEKLRPLFGDQAKLVADHLFQADTPAEQLKEWVNSL